MKTLTIEDVEKLKDKHNLIQQVHDRPDLHGYLMDAAYHSYKNSTAEHLCQDLGIPLQEIEIVSGAGTVQWKKIIGLGDAVAFVVEPIAKAFGVEDCGGCQKRKEKLNDLVQNINPFS